MKHNKAILDWYDRILTSGTAKPLAPLQFALKVSTKNISVSTTKSTFKKIHNQSFESILNIIHN